MAKEVGYKTQQYQNIHAKLRRKYSSASKCSNRKCDGVSKRYDWALKKGHQYSENVEDYTMLCRRCHINQDSTNISRKLSDADILSINTKLKSGAFFSEIRQEYGISTDTIRRLYKGKFNELDWSFMFKKQRVLNAYRFDRVKEMLLNGCLTAKICEELKINVRYLPDLFKNLHGVSIKEFLKENKVTRKYDKA